MNVFPSLLFVCCSVGAIQFCASEITISPTEGTWIDPVTENVKREQVAGHNYYSWTYKTDSYGLGFRHSPLGSWESICNPNDTENLLFSPFSLCLDFEQYIGAAEDNEMEELLESYRKIENDSRDRNFTLAIGTLSLLDEKVKLPMRFKFNVESKFTQTRTDFANRTAIMDRVNSWAAGKTRNQADPIMVSPPDHRTFWLIVNTLYFKGKWKTPFPKKSTFEGSFNNSDGSVGRAQMMILKDKVFRYVHDPVKKIKVVELPYYGNFSMVLIMPTESLSLKGMRSLFPFYDRATLHATLDSMKPTKLNVLSVPKFTLQDTNQLHRFYPALKENYNQRNGDDGNVQSIQRAILEVDEEGITGRTSAQTHLIVRPKVLSTEDFVADRPFLFMVRDKLNGVNLLMGQINEIPR